MGMDLGKVRGRVGWIWSQYIVQNSQRNNKNEQLVSFEEHVGLLFSMRICGPVEFPEDLQWWARVFIKPLLGN